MRQYGNTILVAVFLVVTGAAYAAETPYELAWVSQLGTSSGDRSYSVAIDGSGNAYISGHTYGDLGGPNAGAYDAFLVKYDSSGSLLWTRQLGTSSYDFSWSVAIDGSGNAYISGHTYGDLGGPNAGYEDAFLAKYDSAGALLWTRQLGTSSLDRSWSVAIDGSGNAYISGYTGGSLGGPNTGSYDAFLAKYDSSGSPLWTRQLGTSSLDRSWSVAIDGSGNAYISGETMGSLGGPNAGYEDAFLAKYDSAGALLWTRQLGTSSYDSSWSVAIDGSGNAYISGYTEGSLGGPNAGSGDAFLAKYDDSGAFLWTRQLGTSSADYSLSVAIDGSGNAYISGRTYGSLGGPNAGSADAFLAKYDSAGFLLWTRQLGTNGDDHSYSVAIDGSGNAYISGLTYGNLGGPNAGSGDAFLAKYVPETAPPPSMQISPLLSKTCTGLESGGASTQQERKNCLVYRGSQELDVGSNTVALSGDSSDYSGQYSHMGKSHFSVENGIGESLLDWATGERSETLTTELEGTIRVVNAAPEQKFIMKLSVDGMWAGKGSHMWDNFGSYLSFAMTAMTAGNDEIIKAIAIPILEDIGVEIIDPNSPAALLMQIKQEFDEFGESEFRAGFGTSLMLDNLVFGGTPGTFSKIASVTQDSEWTQWYTMNVGWNGGTFNAVTDAFSVPADTDISFKLHAETWAQTKGWYAEAFSLISSIQLDICPENNPDLRVYSKTWELGDDISFPGIYNEALKRPTYDKDPEKIITYGAATGYQWLTDNIVSIATTFIQNRNEIATTAQESLNSTVLEGLSTLASDFWQDDSGIALVESSPAFCSQSIVFSEAPLDLVIDCGILLTDPLPEEEFKMLQIYLTSSDEQFVNLLELDVSTLQFNLLDEPIGEYYYFSGPLEFRFDASEFGNQHFLLNFFLNSPEENPSAYSLILIDDVYVTANAPIPEPGTIVLAMVSAFGMFGVIRRRRG